MKFFNESLTRARKRLYGLLHSKMLRIHLGHRNYDEELEVWRFFCKSLGITEVNTPDLYDNPAADQKNIIIKDPWLGDGNFLSIPKDVAEKFLVLGVP